MVQATVAGENAVLLMLTLTVAAWPAPLTTKASAKHGRNEQSAHERHLPCCFDFMGGNAPGAHRVTAST